jgi:hypothetical protein
LTVSDADMTVTAAERAWDAWVHDCSVIPIRTDGSKRPTVEWKPYQDRLPTRAEMDAWFGPNGAAAVICGSVSGGLVMIEMEGADFEAGTWERFRAAAVDRLGEARWRQITGCVEMSPSGGPHLFVRCPQARVGNLKLARRPRGDDTVEVIMETRGEGGYCVLAGSTGHASGRPWIAAKGGFGAVATVSADELHAILDAARDLDEMPVRQVAVDTDTPERPSLRIVGDGPFDAVVADYNARTTWAEVLAGAFELAYIRGDVGHWHRIGSDNEVGATTNKTGRDTLIVFSSSTPFESFDGSPPAPSYDRFGATAVLRHGGDRTAAYRALRDAGYGPPRPTQATPPPPPPPHDQDATESDEEPPTAPVGPIPIRWDEFWRREHIGEDWLVQPILPRGRQVALWARHKTGKSLLTLEVAAALATGRPCLSQPAAEPVDVIYLDMEMTEDDLHERLVNLGYGPEVDLDRLHYYLLPSLPPLDAAEGGACLVNLADLHRAQAVVIDTMARVVAGDEDKADTYRDFYRFTGLHLKARGISVLRLDHGGKDPTRGQRGSSGKGDDVDVVWQLRPKDAGLELVRDVARMSWVPERVSLVRGEDPLRHTVTSGGLWPAGTDAIAKEMSAMGITARMKQTEALAAFRAGGGEGKNEVVRAAWKWLKEQAEREANEWPEDSV